MNLNRYYVSKILKPFGRLSKPPELLSRRYLDWIRSRPCVATGFICGVDAHHVLKKSQGKNDFAAIPLRHDVHIEGHTSGWESVEEKYSFDVKDALIATLIERVWTLEEELHGRRKRGDS